MATRRTEDGGDWPPEGDRPPEEPPELPGLPPEWGRIVIPDDASALAAEAEQVRRELRRKRRRRRSSHAPALRRSALGVPLLIMSVAVLITLISLFAMTWSGSTPPGRSTPLPTPMPAVTLTQHGGRGVALNTVGPAAILLVEGCDCDRLIAETTAAAPPDVAVVVVDRSPPTGGTPPAGVLWLLDPDSSLRAALGLSPPTGAAATVMLIDRQQNVVLTTRTTTVNTFQTNLVTL